MKVSNNLSIEVYSSGTTLISDPGHELVKAKDIQFSTGYPGGLYLDASFMVERKVVDQWAIDGAKRVVIRNGHTLVYEGAIDNLETALARGGQGVNITCSGYWGKILNRWRLRKIWADDYLGEDTWTVDLSVSGSEKCYIDRQERIRFTPKHEAWAENDYAQVHYLMPTGQLIRRIKFDFKIEGPALEWEIGLYSVDTASLVWFAKSPDSGSGITSEDWDLSLAPTQEVILYFACRKVGGSTPPSDGTVYGEFSNLVVYSETGLINAQEIAKDVVAYCTDLNTSVASIGALTLDLTPFAIGDSETLADILTNASSFGDASFNSWAFSVQSSETVGTPNGKPVLSLAQRPALTDYDYVVRYGDNNLVMPFSLVRDFAPGSIVNYVTVKYADAQGMTHILTPDDDAALKDTASIALYGRQEGDPLDAGNVTSAMALNYGKTHLARMKSPQYIVNGPIQVMGSIRTKAGNLIPACEVVAGKRIRIENYLEDLSGVGLTFLISSTTYTAATQTVNLQVGRPQALYFTPTAGTSGGRVTSRVGAGAGGSTQRQLVYLIPGALSVAAGTLRVYNEFNASLTITKVKIAVGTAPVGASILVDVNIDGTTIFTTQSNRPEITTGTNEGETTTIEVASLDAGHYLTIDVDQVGSGTAGSDLSVHVVCS